MESGNLLIDKEGIRHPDEVYVVRTDNKLLCPILKHNTNHSNSCNPTKQYLPSYQTLDGHQPRIVCKKGI